MAVWWAGILTGLALCHAAEAAPACRVVRVVDGDTVQMACQGVAHRVRLLGYDSPEVTHPGCEAERVAGLEATQVLRDLVALGEVTGFAITGRDRYGRDLADLAIAGRDVAAVMLGSGLALPYGGGQRTDWCVVLGDGSDGQYCPSYVGGNTSLTKVRFAGLMTAYRRLRLPGATYFFTLCLERPGSSTLTDHIDALRFAYARTVQELPVTCHAMVILPDHLHAVMTEPAGGVFYSERWRRIKARFSHAIAVPGQTRPSLVAKRERGIWQRRFWEHAIRSDAEFTAAVRYCEGDAVTHGLVSDAREWPYSSFVRRRIAAVSGSLSDGHPVVRDAQNGWISELML